MRSKSLLKQALFVGFTLAIIALTANALSLSNLVNMNVFSDADAPTPRVEQQLIRSSGGDVGLRNEEVIPSIGINLSGKMDVALAIGRESFGDGSAYTGTISYADFENELRTWFNTQGNPPGPYGPGYYLTVPGYYDTPNNELWDWAKAKYGPNAPMLLNSDLYIDASQMISLEMTEAFPWWEYDHVYPDPGTNGIDHTDNKYYEYTDQSTNSSYVQSKLDRHITLTDNGATLKFEGYHEAGLCDFTYLPNNEATRKIIEYGVDEQGSAHAFGGNGFFFNCKINDGIYGDASSPQKMDGYLMYFQYNTYYGQRMLIYKFKDVNTKLLHQAANFQSSTPTTSGSFSFAGGTWYCVAQSNLYKLAGSVNGTGERAARRIKIEIDPQYIRVWFNGIAQTNSQITNTPFSDYQTELGLDPDDYIVKVTNNAASGWALLNSTSTDPSVPGSIILDQDYISGYGFGPMASYNSHRCSQQTIFTITSP